MKNNQNKQKDLGIFYTPPLVVDFIFDMLNIMKDKEDKDYQRWQSKKPRAHYPSVIDPACGEGIFLKTAITSGFTGENLRYKAPYVWGIDIDENVVNRWEEISLLSLFRNDEGKMKNHFYHQNGLIPLKDKKIIYKKAEDGLQKFDAVVGNPPYGGIGLQEITPELEEALYNFEIWKKSVRKEYEIDIDKPELFGNLLSIKDKERLKKFPIEVLFIDRFIQLSKPGGYIAIIIPDGILANSSLHYVREFIAEKTEVIAIISLPRGTFKEAGTNAKTSILILKKKKEKGNKLDYPVFLTSTEKLSQDNFDKIINSFKKFYYDQY